MPKVGEFTTCLTPLAILEAAGQLDFRLPFDTFPKPFIASCRSPSSSPALYPLERCPLTSVPIHPGKHDVSEDPVLEAAGAAAEFD
jgi:hypothetical protein